MGQHKHKAASAIWDANMRELRKRQPMLAAKLEEWAKEPGHKPKYDEMVTPAGKWITGLASEPFFQPNALPTPPWGEGETLPLIFLCGVGVDDWLFRSLRAIPADTPGVLVLEPNIELIAAVLRSTAVYSAAPAGCRLSFAVEPKEAPVEEALEVNVIQLGLYIAANAKIWAHPGELAAFSQSMSTLQKAVRERIITKIQELGNSAEDTLLGFRQISMSSPWIALMPSVDALRADFKGRPFIWVASGPSLDKNVHLLKENRDRAVIICADTALRKLLEAGIVPHIAVALERGTPVYHYLEKVWTRFPEEAKKVLLVTQAVCVPEAAGKWPGPKIVVGKQEVPMDNWLLGGLLGGEVMVSGMSVAHMGVSLAANMGASSIALMGQDLSYGPGRVTHAGSTVHWSARRIETERGYTPQKGDILVPGTLGGTVVTHEIWLLFLRILERIVAGLDMPVFNCTEGGAMIEGTKVMPLADWMKANLHDSFSRTPAEVIRDAAYSKERRAEAAAGVYTKVEQSIKAIASTRERLNVVEAKVAQATAPGLPREKRVKLSVETADALDKTHAVSGVLEFVGQSYVMAGMARLFTLRELPTSEAIEEWKEIYTEIIAGHRSALDFMENWLTYVAEAVRLIAERWDDGYSTGGLPFFTTYDVRDADAVEASLMVKDALDRVNDLSYADDGNRLLRAHILMDNLIARADHKWWYLWDDKIDWKLALILEQEGRVAEAAYFLDRMENRSMAVFGLSNEAGVAFMKDTARILSGNDVAYAPDFEKARMYAQNALEQDDDEADARRVLSQVNAREVRYYANFLAVIDDKNTPQRVAAEWRLEQAKLEQALSDEPLDDVMEKVLAAVKKYARQVPDGTAAYLQWLLTRIERARNENNLSERGRAVEVALAEVLPMFNVRIERVERVEQVEQVEQIAENADAPVPVDA
ncbi:MAG: DUF115 domain-containing protein [Synergistaceae bacterium]|jgi:hypothetical protein|nr:DUF115 domain-containing protein [Synergistaceae bacterium]